MASEAAFHNRRVVQLENDAIRISVTVEGGHLAEILHKGSGVNPLWAPPWPSIEPCSYDRARHPEYGGNSEGRLLSGIMGHNLCLDLFGPPSEEEAAAGMDVHGEAGIVPYKFTQSGVDLTARCRLPTAELSFERHIKLLGAHVLITEIVENLSALDRPIAWTQHVTLGPPFLTGSTQFRVPSVIRSAQISGDAQDLRRFPEDPPSGGYAAHLLDPEQKLACFLAYSPELKILLGYEWQRDDFPWLGVWEENRSRTHAPWNGRTITRGMEFGVSPVPETRRAMIERGTMFGTPTYRWIAARGRLKVDYYAAIYCANAIPESLSEFQDYARSG